MTRFGVLRFPGTCDDDEALAACELVGDGVMLWHGDRDLKGVDAIVVPGGFSYGDYLRCGAIARFSPVMASVVDFARDGGPVLGICNGFQILCEAGLLPGALLPNVGLRFICHQAEIEVEHVDTPFTQGCEAGELLSIPVKHHDGRYYAPTEQLAALEANGQVVFRYVGLSSKGGDAPNGSSNGVAGVCNEQRNVVGLMPHPEHAVLPLHGSEDGLKLFASATGTAVGV